MQKATLTLYSVTTGLIIGLTPALTSATPFNGVYAGFDAGPIWASSSYSTTPGCPGVTDGGTFCNSSPDASSANGTAVATSGTGEFNFKRFNYDVHAGYNWDLQNLLLGGEAEFGGMNLGESKTADGVFPFPFLGTTYVVQDSLSTNWLATVRARAGYVVREQFMLYATGGLAFTDVRVTSSYRDNAVDLTFPGGSGNAAKSNFQTGWTLGAGGEWQFNEACSVKLEYLYVKFASMNLPLPVSNTAAFAQTMQMKASLHAEIVRLGFNYRF